MQEETDKTKRRVPRDFHSRYRLILKAKQRNGDQDGKRNVRRKTKDPEGRPRARDREKVSSRRDFRTN